VRQVKVTIPSLVRTGKGIGEKNAGRIAMLERGRVSVLDQRKADVGALEFEHGLTGATPRKRHSHLGFILKGGVNGGVWGNAKSREGEKKVVDVYECSRGPTCSTYFGGGVRQKIDPRGMWTHPRRKRGGALTEDDRRRKMGKGEGSKNRLRPGKGTGGRTGRTRERKTAIGGWTRSWASTVSLDQKPSRQGRRGYRAGR